MHLTFFLLDNQHSGYFEVPFFVVFAILLGCSIISIVYADKRYIQITVTSISQVFAAFGARIIMWLWGCCVTYCKKSTVIQTPTMNNNLETLEKYAGGGAGGAGGEPAAAEEEEDSKKCENDQMDHQVGYE